MRLIYILFILLSMACSKQNYNYKCNAGCDSAGDEKANTSLIHYQIKNKGIEQKDSDHTSSIFGLRIGIVQKKSNSDRIEELEVLKAIDQLNIAFSQSELEFFVDEIEYIDSDLVLEDMTAHAYKGYNEFSEIHDKDNMISLYIMGHGREFCEVNASRVSCHKTGGFSYILSNRSNNVVVSKYDLMDQKLLAHEFGHFFGLYHTFEKDQFGKDRFLDLECSNRGDRICDTPPDPGGVYEIYVNYHTCEMQGLKDENGNDYKPIIENYMSYYKPCYMRPYSFTNGQIEILNQAADSKFRIKFRNKTSIAHVE